MTEPNHQEDEQWLAALAGNPDPGADPRINQQATALRKALKERNTALNAAVPEADDALYQQILFKLRRERIGESAEPESGRKAIAFSRGAGAGSLTSEKTPPRKSFRPAYWGLAASLVLGTVLVLQSGLLDLSDSEFAVRGDRHATMLIVEDPQTRSKELLNGLKAAGAEPRVEQLPSGRVKIIVKSSPAVTDYLMLERIKPAAKGEQIVLILDPVPK
jgi:hypothetical protein